MRLKLFIVIISFANLLVTPTLIVIQDSGQDISIFLNFNEEENSEEKGISFSEYVAGESKDSTVLLGTFHSMTNSFYSISYKTIYQKIVSPPPDFIIES
ncbi:hypothetical protein [Psychroflexus montanilacus]|uniref:hypothetical protein n=1 Tax=Psychroflexus montanilacus TaxID=2873598 RepID=UPI001CCD044C|nr:hypothetical protein [Psychroflexus montanilacus]MBZ9652625.1 hypothetical protein [Psychroflexus montanilacus]